MSSQDQKLLLNFAFQTKYYQQRGYWVNAIFLLLQNQTQLQLAFECMVWCVRYTYYCTVQRAYSDHPPHFKMKLKMVLDVFGPFFFSLKVVWILALVVDKPFLMVYQLLVPFFFFKWGDRNNPSSVRFRPPPIFLLYTITYGRIYPQYVLFRPLLEF